MIQKKPLTDSAKYRAKEKKKKKKERILTPKMSEFHHMKFYN